MKKLSDGLKFGLLQSLWFIVYHAPVVYMCLMGSQLSNGIHILSNGIHIYYVAGTVVLLDLIVLYILHLVEKCIRGDLESLSKHYIRNAIYFFKQMEIGSSFSETIVDNSYQSCTNILNEAKVFRMFVTAFSLMACFGAGFDILELALIIRFIVIVFTLIAISRLF